MDYPLPVFFAVLGAAALHASWNALVRAGANPLLHTAALVIWTGVIGLPIALTLGLPDPASWPWLAGSVIIHVFYYFTLARAYSHGALSVIYPIVRGGAPLFVSLGSLMIIGESPSLLGWVGVLLISFGVLGIAFKADLRHARVALGWALACSLTIAIYTVVDGVGARLSANVLSFTAWMFMLEGLLFIVLLSLAGQGRALFQYIGQRLAVTAICGVLSAVGYGTVLWAMTQAPIALVSATRETSVLFAALIGVWFMRERLTARQWSGAFIIVLGLVALRL